MRGYLLLHIWCTYCSRTMDCSDTYWAVCSTWTWGIIWEYMRVHESTWEYMRVQYWLKQQHTVLMCEWVSVHQAGEDKWENFRISTKKGIASNQKGARNKNTVSDYCISNLHVVLCALRFALCASNSSHERNGGNSCVKWCSSAGVWYKSIKSIPPMFIYYICISFSLLLRHFTCRRKSPAPKKSKHTPISQFAIYLAPLIYSVTLTVQRVWGVVVFICPTKQ